MRRLMVAIMLVGIALIGCESPSKQRAQEAINDAEISAAVQAKLTADRSSNFALVSVDSDRGVVRLRGAVSSSEQRKRAEELARQVKGVIRVVNSLSIAPQSTTTGKLSE
jgi:hyperosmotically inducible protein